MGHSSKKKKKRSGGGQGRGWASSKDSSCGALVDENPLADELTVLWVLFHPFIAFVSACYYRIRYYSHMRNIIEMTLSTKPWKATFYRNRNFQLSVV